MATPPYTPEQQRTDLPLHASYKPTMAIILA